REPYEKKKDNMTEPGSTPLDLLKQRKAAAIGKPFLAKLLKDFTVQIDKDVFMAAVDAIAPVFATAKAKQLRNPNGEYCIDESHESTVLQAVPADKIDAVLVPLPGTPVTLRQFLTETVNTGFCIKKAGKDDVMKHVRGLAYKFIEHEMIAREGYRRGLHNSRAVQDEMQMWKANYCAQFLRNRYLDSVKVTDEEVLALYDSLYKEKTSSVVQYAEIFSAGLTVMQEAVDRIGGGEKFGSVAAALTERKGMREKQGLYPETQVSLTGELSRHLGEMKPGEIKGPLKTADGYVLLQLIEKKQAKDTLSRFEQLKDLLHKAAVSKKLYARMYSTTKDFARSLQPEINTQVLSEIKVSPVPMYTVRLMGFGGRMLAYPFSTTWENWIPEYLHKKETP
ncbi:MAG: peptidyl-prolyl cis-trans isomerase, partial [Ignavibacteriales bacterium]|nr:peptidyl-prolyl cis-trans isomerase [Ignavibacteriales bacterium]